MGLVAKILAPKALASIGIGVAILSGGIAHSLTKTHYVSEIRKMNIEGLQSELNKARVERFGAQVANANAKAFNRVLMKQLSEKAAKIEWRTKKVIEYVETSELPVLDTRIPADIVHRLNCLRRSEPGADCVDQGTSGSPASLAGGERRKPAGYSDRP